MEGGGAGPRPGGGLRRVGSGRGEPARREHGRVRARERGSAGGRRRGVRAGDPAPDPFARRGVQGEPPAAREAPGGAGVAAGRRRADPRAGPCAPDGEGVPRGGPGRGPAARGPYGRRVPVPAGAGGLRGRRLAAVPGGRERPAAGPPGRAAGHGRRGGPRGRGRALRGREGVPHDRRAPPAAGEALPTVSEALHAPEDAFFATVDALVRAAPGSEAAGILRRLAAHRQRADAYRTRMRAAPPLFPVLNPLFPALRHTAAHWSADGRPVVLVHDRQNALTPGRIARIVQLAHRDGIALHGLRLVDSRDDARVQIADFLAGIARKIASDELAGTGDPELTACLRPYVAAQSVWGDARSWARLAPAGENPGRAAEINSGV
ncbi:hypothetical protein AB0L14_35295 [Streptomyces sp. NPDC052727]|uniref:hypothetical protein n=1 Tax=Streptomyces sp. NPDC052727 TaxID=3154854 RepID=UPI00343F1B55